MNYGPPEIFDSESEDSEFGDFRFSGDYDEYGQRIRREMPVRVVSKEDEVATSLYNCAFYGDSKEFREIWEANQNILDVNQPLKTYDWTPLMFACQGHHIELVEYLLFKLNADPNANSNDWTALMLACRGPMDIYSNANEILEDEEKKALTICQWLIDRKAMVDKSNLRRETALMHAAGNGFVSIIELLLKNKATLEACDTQGKTALFYAVESNRFDATKKLIECGALVNTENCFRQTPRLIAEDNGYDDLLTLFPPEPVFNCVPSHYSTYNTHMDLVPTVFPNKEAPAYSPDMCTMLDGMRASSNKYKIYQAQIGLPELLTITDDRLKEIGIEFSYQRNRILLGLLRFHEKPWSRDSLRIPKTNSDIQDYFNMLANCLRQLIVIESALKFVESHPIFANISVSDESQRKRQQINQELLILRNNVMQIIRSFEKVDELAPPPPLFVNQHIIQDALNQKKTFRAELKRKIKIFGCIGIGIAAIAVIKSQIR